MADVDEDKESVPTEAARFWRYLDKLYADDPEAYDKLISKTLEEGKDMLKPPQPRYCLKLSIKLKHNCSRLYLNVCSWDTVPRPETDAEPVPVKGGILRHNLDRVSRKKTTGLIYDVAFNPSVLDEVEPSQELQDMLHQLCFQYLEDVAKVTVTNKHTFTKLKEKCAGPENDIKLALDENWKHQFPKDLRADFGDSILKEIEKLQLEKESQAEGLGGSLKAPLPKLKTQPDSAKTKSTLIEEISSCTSVTSTRSPEYTLSVREADKTVCAVVTLPGVKSVSDITLDVSKVKLSLGVEGHYELSVTLPLPVNEDATRAAFKRKTATLTVTMPCL